MPGSLFSQTAPLGAATTRVIVAAVYILAGFLDVLDTVGHKAAGLLPELLEPWQIISTAEAAGPYTEVTVLAYSAFGQAAMLWLRLIALIYERLQPAGITLRGC